VKKLVFCKKHGLGRVALVFGMAIMFSSLALADAEYFNGLEDGDVTEFTGDTSFLSVQQDTVYNGSFSGKLQGDSGSKPRAVLGGFTNDSYENASASLYVTNESEGGKGTFELFNENGDFVLNTVLRADTNEITVFNGNNIVLQTIPSTENWYKITFAGLNYSQNEVSQIYVNGSVKAQKVSFNNGMNKLGQVKVKSGGANGGFSTLFDDISLGSTVTASNSSGGSGGGGNIIYDDFNDGDISSDPSWSGDTGSAGTATNPVFEGSHAGFVESQSGTNKQINTGLSGSPSNITYDARVEKDSDSFEQGRFRLLDSGTQLVNVGVEPGSSLDYFTYCGGDQLLTTGNADFGVWYEVKITGIDYSAGTVDSIKINGSEKFSNVDFCGSRTGTPSDIGLQALGGGTHKAYFDDISSFTESKGLKASFSVNQTPEVGERTEFDGSNSTGNISSYEWDLDGDSTFEKTGKIVSKTYTSSGAVDVSLRISNSTTSKTETKTFDVRKERLEVALTSDWHIGKCGDLNGRSMKNLVEYLGNQNPDAVFVNGDLTEGGSDKSFNLALSNMTAIEQNTPAQKVHWTFGDGHDQWGWNNAGGCLGSHPYDWSGPMSFMRKDNVTSPYRTVTYGNNAFILVNNIESKNFVDQSFHTTTGPSSANMFTYPHINWTKSEVEEYNQKGYNTFVLFHHQLYNSTQFSETWAGVEFPAWRTSSDLMLDALRENTPDVVVTSHVHSDAGSFVEDGSQPGGKVIWGSFRQRLPDDSVWVSTPVVRDEHGASAPDGSDPAKETQIMEFDLVRGEQEFVLDAVDVEARADRDITYNDTQTPKNNLTIDLDDPVTVPDTNDYNISQFWNPVRFSNESKVTWYKDTEGVRMGRDGWMISIERTSDISTFSDKTWSVNKTEEPAGCCNLSHEFASSDNPYSGYSQYYSDIQNVPDGDYLKVNSSFEVNSEIYVSDMGVQDDTNSAPSASISANTTDIQTGETVLLDASGSTDSDGSITQFDYDVDGDGTFEKTVGGSTLENKYTSVGSFDATVRVTDNASATDTASTTITVGSPPTADITANTTTIKTGETVEFDASGSTDSDGTISSTAFDLDGDGTFETSGTTAQREFTSTGDLPVSVKVTDNDGLTDTDSLTVSVTSTTSTNTTTTTATTVNASGGQLVIAFAIVAFSFAFLAVKTPDKQGGLQILNYLMFFLTVFFLGYLAISTVDNGTSILDVLTPWVNSFYAPLALVFAYFAIMMLSKVLEEFDSLDL